jgi:PucR family transcriptional regulator, purine catabolism regulatory protein
VAITARRLAQHPRLGLALVAGRENADRPVTWAHAIELTDPTPYLFGGELVMTTGLTVGATDSEQFDYVARLSAADVAALAFDTGTTFHQVPDGIVRAGDAFGLPVLKVPASTPFIAITRAVIDEVNADEVRSVQRIVDQQETMARETLRGGIPGLVTALSHALSATAVVLGTDGRLLAAGGPDQDRVSQLGADLVRAARPRTREQASRVVADGDGYCTLQTLRATQTVRGYLAVRSGDALTTSDRVLVANAVSLICIELEKPARVLDAEHRLRTSVTRALISTPQVLDPAVLRYFGFDPDADVVALVLTDVGPALPAEGQAQRLLDETGAPYLLCTYEDDIVIALPATESGRSARIHRALGAQLQRTLGGGASLPGRFAVFDTCLTQARTAARAHAPGALSEFGDLGAFGVILAARSTGELEILCQPLSPLDAGLVETLRAYLGHNGHVENAAAELDVHRHTMRNRLARIGDLVGADLHSADTRAELWLAIKARELLALRDR